jgi:hypothetical protein
MISGKMTNRIVEAEIVLLLWLFSASVVSYSIVGMAFSLYSETATLQNSTLTHADYDVEASGSDEKSLSLVGGEEDNLG